MGARGRRGGGGRGLGRALGCPLAHFLLQAPRCLFRPRPLASPCHRDLALTHTSLLVTHTRASPRPTLAVNTNGNIVADEEMGEVIQLQGDQRQKVKEWILDQELVTVHEQDRIVIHGF